MNALRSRMTSGTARWLVPALLASLLVALLAYRSGSAASPSGDRTRAVDAIERATVPPPVSVEELSDTFESPFALAGAVLEALREGDHERLLRYRVDDAEWYSIVWPALPASHPERGLSWDYVWRDLNQKSLNALRRSLARHEGHGYRLLRVEFAGETSDYGSYRVHRDARCVVEMTDGRLVAVDVFGSVIERKGRFKAFSYVVD